MPAPKAKHHADRIAELREGRGYSCARIARMIGVSRSAVAWHCLINGIESPRNKWASTEPNPGPLVVMRNGHQVRRFTPAEDALLLQLEAQGLNYSVIGRRLGRPRNSIVGHLATLARRDARTEASVIAASEKAPE